MADADDTGKKPDPGTSDDGGTKQFDEKYVKELREENKARRLENEKLSAELSEIAKGIKERKAEEDKKLEALARALGLAEDTEVDPVQVLTTEVAALKAEAAKNREAAEAATAKMQKARIETAIQAEAAQVGLAEGVEASDILPHIGADSVTYNSESEVVEGAKAAVEALAKAKPYFFNTENAQPVTSTPGGGTPPRAPQGPELPDTVEGRMLKAELEKSRASSGFSPLLPAQGPRVGSNNLGLPS